MCRLSLRLPALILAFCLLFSSVSFAEEPHEVTNVNFTLGFALHPEGFPEQTNRLRDWQTFLDKIDIQGTLAQRDILTHDIFMNLDAAVRILGEEIVPFSFDAQGTYRRIVTPMFHYEPLGFSTLNFFEFMLKPYYYLRLPTNYMALLLYPAASREAAAWIYEPIEETIASSRAEALGEDAVVSDSVTYTVPYEQLETLCTQIASDINGKYKWARFYFAAMLCELYADEMVVDTLRNLPALLAALDPARQGMTVTETPDSIALSISGDELFSRRWSDTVNEFSMSLPFPQDSYFDVLYRTTVNYRWEARGQGGADLSLTLSMAAEDDTVFWAAFTGEGLPREGEQAGEGRITLETGGSWINEPAPPVTLAFRWSRDAGAIPYGLTLDVDWIHPQTDKAAISLQFHGTFTQGDESVLREVAYPEEDVLSLNNSSLSEYKEAWGKTVVLYTLPFLLEMPVGVLDDIVEYMVYNDILLSLTE